MIDIQSKNQMLLDFGKLFDKIKSVQQPKKVSTQPVKSNLNSFFEMGR